MTFLGGVFAWILQKILDWLLSRAIAEVNERTAELVRDRERKEINEKNIKAYEESLSRMERINAAIDLLNRRP